MTLDVRRTLAGLSTCILSMSFSPSGRTLVAGDDRGGLCGWDLGSTGQRSYAMGVKAVDIAWLPDESGFLATGLTRMVGLFSPDEEIGQHLWFDNLNVRYLQGAASRFPESACVMVVDFG